MNTNSEDSNLSLPSIDEHTSMFMGQIPVDPSLLSPCPTSSLLVINKHDPETEKFAFDSDVYKNLKNLEIKKKSRDTFDLESNTQFKINIANREKMINIFVLLGDDFKFVPETTFLSVKYLDLCLPMHVIDCMDQFLLVSLSCVVIASKYEEERTVWPSLEDICKSFYIICNENGQDCRAFTNQEIISMELQVLGFLKFEVSIPTTRNFLQILLPEIIKHTAFDNSKIFTRSKTFMCLVDYIAELSILDYGLGYYPSSIVAASTIFMAKFIIQPSQNPWDTFLVNLTGYKASELKESVCALHRLLDKLDIVPSAIKGKYDELFVGNSSSRIICSGSFEKYDGID